MQRTLDKLKSICQLHGVDMHIISGPPYDWHFVFDAPPKMMWVSGTSAGIVYEGELRGIIGYLREELKYGFCDADEETLRLTGQLSDPQSKLDMY
jgi:hypothetical protein